MQSVTVVPSPGPDRAGVALGALCAFHCLATPALILFLPTALAAIIAAEWLEWALVGSTVLVGAVAIVALGWRRHGRRLPVILFGVGVVLLLGSRMERVEALIPEAALVAAGAALVIGAHVHNYQCSRRCAACASGAACT